jgi:hypothetical protein
MVAIAMNRKFLSDFQRLNCWMDFDITSQELSVPYLVVQVRDRFGFAVENGRHSYK